tara:strand:+ start:137 stop:1207 length:1071 start_codon:yes stop_codon:yes gene_type:complete
MESLKLQRKYVHISSDHRFDQEHDEARIKVHMHTPIKNVHSVAVKQFSIANAMENIRSGEQTLKWLEAYLPQGGTEATARMFSVDIPTGYYSAADLCTAINSAISNLPTRKCSDDPNETDSVVTFLANSSTYQIEVSLSNQGAGTQGNKYFQPITSPSTLWKRLGFSEEQMVSGKKRRAASQDIGEDDMLIDNAEEAVEYQVLPPALFQMGNGTPTTLTSKFPYTIESDDGIYLCSHELTRGGGTFESSVNQDNLHVVARPVDILEWIQFDQARYSHVHYNTNTPHFHYMNDVSVSDFEVSLRSSAGRPLKINECGHFSLVLMFETISHDEISAEFIKQYNDEGYALAHKKDYVRI